MEEGGGGGGGGGRIQKYKLMYRWKQFQSGWMAGGLLIQKGRNLKKLIDCISYRYIFIHLLGYYWRGYVLK